MKQFWTGLKFLACIFLIAGALTSIYATGMWASNRWPRPTGIVLIIISIIFVPWLIGTIMEAWGLED